MSPPRDLFEEEEVNESEKIRVNKRYAKEYQSRKQREELRNVRQEQGDDNSSTSSESEDEHGDLLSPSVDISILKVSKNLK